MSIEQKKEIRRSEKEFDLESKIEKEPIIEAKEEKKEIHKKEEINKTSAKKISAGHTEEHPGSTAKSQVLTKIENILEDGLEEVYFSLDEPLKKEFKAKGEKTAVEINSLISKTKTVFKQIFELIKEWFKIIPEINKFFVEKQAKIKTDKIFNLIQKNDY